MGRKTKLAASLLGIGYSVEEVSEQLGLERSYLMVLKRSRMFNIEMDKARNRFVKAEAANAKDKIWARGSDAVDVCDEVMSNPAEKGATRVAAAREFLGRIVPMKEGADAATPTIIINIGVEELKGIANALQEATELEPGIDYTESGASDYEERGEASGCRRIGEDDSET